MDPFEAELAREAIDAFCSEFGKEDGRLSQAYRDFARHAALPLTFNADLLYRLQERFRRDMRGQPLYIPWIAVADLMLSHLCQTVRPETFRLKETVRLVLLEELQADRNRFWSAAGRQSRLQEIAEFLIQYATHQLNHPSHYVQEAAKAQRLNAQIITQPELVRQSLQETAASLLPQQDPVGALRLASLVDTFAAAVNLTRAETDQTRQDFSLLQTYTGGLAQLAQGQAATAVAQQFQTAFGSDNNIQIAGQTLPGLRQLSGIPPTLSHSLSVSVAGRSDLVFLLSKGEPLPAVSDLVTLRDEQTVIKASKGLAYQGILLFQGESTNPQENIMLGEILLDDDALYEGILEIEAVVSVDSDSNISFSISHQSGFVRGLTATFQDAASTTTPQIIDFQGTIERYTQGVSDEANLPNFAKVDSWLSNTNASRVMIFTGEDGAGKTTIAAQLARFFLSEAQPPNNLMGLAVTTTSSFYFCEPFYPRTLDPRSFALTIASQWAKRDSSFAYLQSTIDNHEEYELDELIKRLLIKPFTDIDELIYPGSIIFLVDDLEAALQYSGNTTIVDVILRMLREVYGVRFLLTAQMQTAVRAKLADVEAEFIYLGDRYDNFDIHVGPPLPGPDMRYPVQVTASASGQSPEQETYSPVTELGYERLARLRDLASNPEEALEIGQKLLNVILREPHYEMVRRSLAMARDRGKEGLRVRLQFDDPVLQPYPWELCHDGRSFIFNNPDQPILLQRTVPTDNPQTPPPLPRPVRLLVAIAAPVDQGRDDVKLQEKVIRVATEEVVTSSELDLQILPNATLSDLESLMQSYQPSIVQFIGYSRGEKEGVLILENDSGRSNLVPVPEITRILAAAPVQCVILSPIGVGETAVSQLAPQFIQQGIPTILAEQFVLPDQPAIEYLRNFYRALLFDRLPFEEAVWNGRTHLATTHREPFWSHISIFSGQHLIIAPAATSSESDASTVARNEEQQAVQEPEIDFSKLSIVPLTPLHFEEAGLKPDYKIRTDIFLNRRFLASMQLNVKPGSPQPLDKIVVHMLFDGVENAKPTIEAISPLEFENFSLKTLLAEWGNLNENESIAQSSAPANNVKSVKLHINDSAYEWEFDKALPQEGKSVQFAAIVQATANMDALNMNLHASLEFAPSVSLEQSYEAKEEYSFSLRGGPYNRWLFVDRESKIRGFIKLLESETAQSLMLIQAEKDMGKSWLLQKMLEYCVENAIPIALIDFRNPITIHELNTILDFLRFVRDRLEQPSYFNSFNQLVNKVTFSEDAPHQESSETIPEDPSLIVDNHLPIKKYESVQEQVEIERQLITSFFECMSSLLQEKQTVVLIVDSYDQMHFEFERFLLTQLIPYSTNTAKDQFGKFVIIVAGRKTPDLDDLYGADVGSQIVQTSLDAFSEEDVREYFIERRGLSDLDLESIHLTSQGIPGLLAMLADHAVASESDDDFFDLDDAPPG